MNKEDLRKRYLARRKELTAAECAQFNVQLYHHFFSSTDLSFLKVIHTYLPLVKNNEPDTWMIIDRLRREFPHIRISIPRVMEDGALEHFFFEGLHQLQTNAWGLLEPKQGIPTLEEKIDLVIVPLLAIDQRGHRVGYGKGYYDRFLKKCKKDCKTIGLSFFEPIDIISDTDVNDVALTACVEPSGVHYFRP